MIKLTKGFDCEDDDNCYSALADLMPPQLSSEELADNSDVKSATIDKLKEFIAEIEK